MTDGSRSWSGRARLGALVALAGLGFAIAGCGGSDDEPAGESPAVETGASGVAGAEPDAEPSEDRVERDEPAAKRDAPDEDDADGAGHERSEGDGSKAGDGSERGTGKGLLGIPGKLKPVAPGSDQCELTLEGQTATIPCDVGRRLLGLDEPR